MHFTPEKSASLIKYHLRKIRLEPGSLSDPDDPSIGLRLMFKTPVPERLLECIGFDLLVPAQKKAPDGTFEDAYHWASFFVTDMLCVCGQDRNWMLELSPIPRVRGAWNCHLTTFIVLVNEASRSRFHDGTPRDWRHLIAKVRFYHLAHRTMGSGEMFQNALFAPIDSVPISDIWSTVPPTIGCTDTLPLEDLLCQADLAFKELDS